MLFFLSIWIVYSYLTARIFKTTFLNRLFYDSFSYIPSFFLLLSFFSGNLSYNVVLVLSTLAMILVLKIFFIPNHIKQTTTLIVSCLILIVLYLYPNAVLVEVSNSANYQVF